jgi:hypothetical protein
METDPVSEMLFSTFLEFRTMDKVFKSVSVTPSSELIRFYMSRKSRLIREV